MCRRFESCQARCFLARVGQHGFGLAVVDDLARDLFDLLESEEDWLPGDPDLIVDLGYLLQDHGPGEGFLGAFSYGDGAVVLEQTHVVRWMLAAAQVKARLSGKESFEPSAITASRPHLTARSTEKRSET